MRTLASLLGGAALIYGVLVAVMYFAQDRLLFLPNVPGRALQLSPAHLGLAFEDLQLPTEDGETLHGWYIPAAQDARTLLFFHGNAGNISHRLESLAIFHRLGLNVLIIDYRGYGRSTGTPSEAGTYADASAAWRYLTETRALDPARIVLFGRSLGGAVAIELASRVRPAALLVESTFTSVPDMAAQLYPWLPVRWLARLRYPSQARIARILCPLLVLHSRGDEIIPFTHAQALYAAAPHPKLLFAMRGGHNDGFLATGGAYVDALAAFIAALDTAPASGQAASRGRGTPRG